MAVREILLAGDKLLRETSGRITDFHSVRPLVNNLKDTLLDFQKRNGIGRGIAAPQIGIQMRAIFISMKDFEGELLNPSIVAHDEDIMLTWDSCFSFKAAFFAKVPRWKEVSVEYQDQDGTKQRITARDGLSELLQHEIDHLDGILFVDRMMQRGDFIIMREQWEKLGKPLLAPMFD